MIIIYAIGSIYALWLFYLAVMNLSRAKEAGKLTKTALVLVMPIFLTGYALDIFVNLFVITFLFLEFPKEWTITGRVKRHLYGSAGWREIVAAWLCFNLLNAFDPDGKHC